MTGSSLAGRILAALKPFRLALVLIIIFSPLLLINGLVRVPEARARSESSAARKRMGEVARLLAEHRAKQGTYPSPDEVGASGVPSGTNRLHAQPILPAADFADLAKDPFTRGPGPMRYTTAADKFLLACAGPDGAWNLDLRNWRPEMSGADPALSHFTYDPTNGTFSPGDVILLGGAGGKP